MPRFSPFASVEIDVEAERDRLEPPPEPGEPFRILVLGDFSGRANRAVFEPSPGRRRPVEIDRDNCEAVLAALRPELRVPVGSASARIHLNFTELDDFHPDRIYRNVELFRALRKTREDLSDPAAFSRAAAANAERAPEAPRPRVPVEMTLDDLIEEAIAETESRPPSGAPPRVRDDWTQFLHELVAPHLVPGVTPRQKDMLAELDAAIGEQMRAVLHHPDFQQLEAAWRSASLLVRELETGPELKVFLLDITKAEFAAALAAGPLERSELYKLIVEETAGTPGADRWAVLAAAYTFGSTPEDAETLLLAGRLGRAAGAPFLAGASETILGCDSLANTPDPDDWPQRTGAARSIWNGLRSRPEAQYVGLALPRLLLRLPYGKETDSTEEFAFEEMPGVPRHEDYLWGNAAVLCACLLGQSFTQSGWDLRPGVVREFSGLPAHVYRENGETCLKPCAEVLLTERAADRVIEDGLMPVLSLRGSDAVRVAHFQSIAAPPAALKGRWS